MANREPPRIVSDDAAVQWRLAEPGVVERSLDGGTTWTRTQTGVAVEPTAGAAPSSTVCWLVGRGGLVLRTTDARTWQRVAAPVNEDLIAVEAVDAQSATVRTAGGARYRTTDGGTTWSRVP